MALYTFGVGLTMPQAMASAMAPFPERAGAASSLLGLCQMTLRRPRRHRPRPDARRLGAALAAFVAGAGLLAFAIFSASAGRPAD